MGHANAQCSLGFMYFMGQGVTQDYKQAVEWYRKAAEQGHANAQCSLGFMYFMGQGVTQDYKQAAEWTRKSAEQGYPMAQYNLGYMYESGQGVTKDLSQAKEWYRKAAARGYDAAKEALANLERRRNLTKSELIDIMKKSGLYALTTDPYDKYPLLPRSEQVYAWDYYQGDYNQYRRKYDYNFGIFLCTDKIYFIEQNRRIETLDYEQLRNDKSITRQWIENKLSSFILARDKWIPRDKIVNMLMAIRDKE